MARTNRLGRLVAWTIRVVWQRWLGPIVNRRMNVLCRFHPSCSEYAALAVAEFGVIDGLRLAFGRVRRCTPENCASCYDPPRLR